jgi:hypothetical protein
MLQQNPEQDHLPRAQEWGEEVGDTSTLEND